MEPEEAGREPVGGSRKARHLQVEFQLQKGDNETEGESI